MRSNRKWYQFSLRFYVVTVAVASAAMAIGVRKLITYRRHDAALSQLVEAAYVTFEHQMQCSDNPTPRVLRPLLGVHAFCQVAALEFDCQHLTSAHATLLIHCPNVSHIGLVFTQSMDEDFVSSLRTLRNLESLRLDSTALSLDAFPELHNLQSLIIARQPCSPSSIAQLECSGSLEELTLKRIPGLRQADLEPVFELRKLKTLNLNLGYFDSDGALSHVRNLSQLEKASVHFRTVAIQDVKALSKLPHLHTLSLSGSSVTNDVVLALSGCQGLRNLNLWGTSVTEKGLRSLQESLPNCEMWHGPR